MANSLHQLATEAQEAPPSAMDLLVELSRLYKIQPATALWRSIEIREVLKAGFPSGIGLDLGCGDGALTGMIARHLGIKPELIGLDPDPNEIKIAERRGIYQKTVCGSGEAMPLEDESIDFVFSNSVLEHIPNLNATIAECSRVLKPGGTFIATVPAPGFRHLLRARKLEGKARDAYLERMDMRLAHYNYLDSADWESQLSKHGLRLKQATDYFNRDQVRRWEFLSGLTAGVLQAFGASNALLYRLQRLTRSDNKTAGGLLSDHPPALWSKLWAQVVAGKTLTEETEGETWGCLLIQAQKTSNTD